MHAFDFSPLFRSTVGFDRLPSLFDAAERAVGSADSYPPYDIVKSGENAYRITLAVAGFAPEDLDIEVREGVLVVKGSRPANDGKARYLHRGIAGRAFERRFQLAEHVEVRGADLANGLLVIDLVRELPEALKPRRIEIKTGKLIENAKAA